ncbi:MAG TPA: alpha/beta hydrolase-fold protein [Longimicrobiales bacterium]
MSRVDREVEPMLEFEKTVPSAAQDGTPVVVLLHGRGSDERDLLGLARYLPEDVALVTPRAPFPAAPWGYGPGWAWYRFLGGDRPEPESFEAAQQALDTFLVGLPSLLPFAPGPLALGGFSQGGTMSLAYALRNPGRVPLVLNFSGFLPDHPSVSATARTVEGTRFFWGHGVADPAIPFALAREGRAALRAAGAELAAHDYPIGHGIHPKELDDAVAWLRGGFGSPATGGAPEHE